MATQRKDFFIAKVTDEEQLTDVFSILKRNCIKWVLGEPCDLSDGKFINRLMLTVIDKNTTIYVHVRLKPTEKKPRVAISIGTARSKGTPITDPKDFKENLRNAIKLNKDMYDEAQLQMAEGGEQKEGEQDV